MNSLSRMTAISLVLLSAVCFGCLATFAKFSYAAGVTPSSLLALRFLIASVILIPVLAIFRVALPKGRNLLGFIGMGLLYTLQSQTFFHALLHANSGLVGLLLYIYPVLVTFGSAALGWERLTPSTIGLLTLALLGIGVTLGDHLDGEPIGVALALLAAAMYAVYILLGKKFSTNDHPLAGAFVIFTTAAIANFALAVPAGLTLPSSHLGWLPLLAIALVSTVIAISAFLAGVGRIGAANASVISTIEPIVTISLGISLFGEQLTAQQILGGVIVLGSVIALTLLPTTHIDRTVKT